MLFNTSRTSHQYRRRAIQTGCKHVARLLKTCMDHSCKGTVAASELLPPPHPLSAHAQLWMRRVQSTSCMAWTSLSVNLPFLSPLPPCSRSEQRAETRKTSL